MPLIRNNGRYGELGHWGKRSGRRFTKKKIFLLVTLLSLSLLFAVSKNSLIPIVQADYNSSFSHTRTLIFGDTQFLGPSGGPIVFKAKADNPNGFSPMTVGPLTVTVGDALIVNVMSFGTGPSGTVTDTQGNVFSLAVTSISGQSSGATTGIFNAIAKASGSDTVTITRGSNNFVGAFLDYSGVSGFGQTGSQQLDSPGNAGTSTVTLTNVASNSWIVENFFYETGAVSGGSVTANSGQILRDSMSTSVCATNGIGFCYSYDVPTPSSSPSLSVTYSSPNCNTPGCFGSHSALELTSSPLSFAKVRWNFNSTCVSLAGPVSPEADFDYSKGTTGLGGNNCSSADIMISKSSINLQTVSARMLEMVMAWSNVKAALKNVTMVLRSSNGTLPSFTENYNPFNDVQARLIWWACPTVTCAGGNQTVFIGHDNTKTVNQETQGNDKIIGVGNPNFKPGVQNSFQTVLNFTGPNNFISGSNQTSTTQNSASGLQMGQDYYILVMVNMDTTQTPASCNCIIQFLGGITSGTGNPSLGIWSVPASCQDSINRVACSLPTPQPTFEFNPLDPSTWGNAIIKGLVWAFSVALPSGLQIIAGVLLQVIQVTFNFVGNRFGWGNIGDNIVTFLSALPTLFGQIGTALGWFGSIVSSVVNTIIIANLLANPYFAGLVNVLNDFKNAFGSGIIISLLTQIAFWFPTSYMIILISTYFLFVFLGGLHGFFDWLHLIKWTSFQLVGLFSMFIDVFVTLITAILGRLSIISPGHKFPRIPHPSPGSLPRVSLHGEIAFFDDPTAWFLAFTGFIFTMMWAGTSAAGLPANTQTVIQSMSTLFLTLFGVGFMVLMLYIPGFILGKLYEKGILS